MFNAIFENIAKKRRSNLYKTRYKNMILEKCNRFVVEERTKMKIGLSTASPSEKWMTYRMLKKWITYWM